MARGARVGGPHDRRRTRLGVLTHCGDRVEAYLGLIPEEDQRRADPIPESLHPGDQRGGLARSMLRVEHQPSLGRKSERGAHLVGLVADDHHDLVEVRVCAAVDHVLQDRGTAQWQ